MEIIGHAGAGALEVPNSRASFARASALGVDRIEFDVIEVAEGLVLAHDEKAARDHEPLSLSQGLGFLAELGIPLNCDVKGWGFEARLSEELANHDTAKRTIVSGHHLGSLLRLRSLLPDLRVGWSVPQPRGYPDRRVPGSPRTAALRGWKWRLPRVAEHAVAAGECDGIMCNYRIASRRLVERVHEAGGEVRVWTVPDPGTFVEMEALGVDGIATNDPRIARI